MNKCKKCGRYNDPAEWPEEIRDSYKPELCAVCFRNQEIDEADEAESEDEEVDSDPDGLEAQEEADKCDDVSECEGDDAD